MLRYIIRYMTYSIGPTIYGYIYLFIDYCQYATGLASYYDLDTTGYHYFISDSRGKDLLADDLIGKYKWEVHYSVEGGC